MTIRSYINQRKELFKQILRYGIVGTVSTGIHYGAYLLMMHVLTVYVVDKTLNANISYAIGYMVGFSVNYVLTTYFTFETKATKKNASGFTISHILNYFIEMGVLNLLLYWHVEKSLAGLVVMVVAVPINFIFLKIAFYVSGKSVNG